MRPMQGWVPCSVLSIGTRKGMLPGPISDVTRRGRPNACVWTVDRRLDAMMLAGGSSKQSGKELDNYVNTAWSGDNIDCEELIRNVKFDDRGLVPAIAQQYDSGEILMMAWMSSDSIRETLRQGRAVYYSRSRKTLWRKGDTSGQVQFLRDVLLDCDGDTLVLKVDQIGVACHTGRRSCFFVAYRPPLGKPEIIADVVTEPEELYGKNKIE